MDLKIAVENIKKNQATIDMLLEKGSISLTPMDDKWVLEHLHEDDGVSVGFATCSSTGGGEFPEHLHENVQEYILCLSGSFTISFGLGGIDGMRIVRERECVSIPPNTLHTSRPLEKNTRNLYVCIPRDPCIRGIK